VSTEASPGVVTAPPPDPLFDADSPELESDSSVVEVDSVVEVVSSVTSADVESSRVDADVESSRVDAESAVAVSEFRFVDSRLDVRSERLSSVESTVDDVPESLPTGHPVIPGVVSGGDRRRIRRVPDGALSHVSDDL
jgi:hypothetical protein